MKYAEAKQGRIFLLRFEQDDYLPDVVESFAADNNINAAVVWFLGGADDGSHIVVGPEDGKAMPPIPMKIPLPGVSEAVGFGTVFLNEASQPRLHMHCSFGRGEKAVTGCTRAGVTVWQIGEAVVMELLDCHAGRKINSSNGFELLEID